MKPKITPHLTKLPCLLACFVGAVAFLMAEKQPMLDDLATAPAVLEGIKKPSDLPESRLRSDIEALDPEAQSRALEIFQGDSFPVADLNHVHVSGDGSLFYICGPGCEHAHKEALAAEAADFDFEMEAEQATESFSAVPVSPFPESLKFNSKPGAPYVIYLNFAGDTIAGTQWNNHSSWAPGPSVAIEVKPFNIPGEDPAVYSPLEQQRIFRTWLRVAEDYAPFNINVTTERPSEAMFATNQVVHVIFSEQYDLNGHQVPYWGIGIGVASIGTFGNSDFHAMRNPAWVFTTSVGDRHLGDVASHEAGHTFGLFHHGLTTIGQDIEYYTGHGSGETQWIPIMGNVGLLRRITQWSNGEYRNANRTNQDDIAIIASKTGYRQEDHGSTHATATPLAISSGGVISSTTPETDPTNEFPANKGIIGSRTDVDVFSFTTGAGTITLNVNPFRISTEPVPGSKGTNLDVSIELYDSAGTLVASNNTPDDTIASITYNAAPGTYFLHVTGSGAGDPFASTPTGYTDYGSVGQYFISGTIVEAPSIYQAWAATYSLTGADAAFDVDFDHDGRSNLLEFAFGTNPVVSDAGPLVWDGIAPPTPGSPIVFEGSQPGGGVQFTARFMRRKDHDTSGSVSYAWRFSSNLSDWESSNATPAPAWHQAPVALTDDASGAYELVEVDFPSLMDTWEKPRFFQVVVTPVP